MVYHKSLMYWYGTEPGPLQWQPVNCLPQPWYSPFISFTANTISIGCTHKEPSYHNCAVNCPLSRLHSIHTNKWESSLLYGCTYTDRYQWTRVSPRKFWILNRHVHHQTAVKLSKFTVLLFTAVILCTDFVEIHNQISALHPSAVAQYHSSQGTCC